MSPFPTGAWPCRRVQKDIKPPKRDPPAPLPRRPEFVGGARAQSMRRGSARRLNVSSSQQVLSAADARATQAAVGPRRALHPWLRPAAAGLQRGSASAGESDPAKS